MSLRSSIRGRGSRPAFRPCRAGRRPCRWRCRNALDSAGSVTRAVDGRGLPRPPQHPAHGAIHRVVAGQVQGLLEMTDYVWEARRASPAVRETSPGWYAKPDRKSHKPRRPNRRALMPVGLSRHSEISSHGFLCSFRSFFAVHNGGITVFGPHSACNLMRQPEGGWECADATCMHCGHKPEPPAPNFWQSRRRNCRGLNLISPFSSNAEGRSLTQQPPPLRIRLTIVSVALAIVVVGLLNAPWN